MHATSWTSRGGVKTLWHRHVRWRRFAALAVLSLAASLTPAAAGTKTTGTWSDPGLQPAPYKKIAVLARIEDDIARRILEDDVVAGLAKLGVEAVAAYQVLTDADLSSQEAIRVKAAELGIDAGFLFTVEQEDKKVKSGSNVHASVGVPVRAGPFSLFLGTSVPLGGGPSTVTTVTTKSQFITADAGGAVWIANYVTSLDAGNEKAAQEIAAQALKQVKKAKLFSKGD